MHTWKCINVKAIVHPKIQIMPSVCRFCHGVLFILFIQTEQRLKHILKVIVMILLLCVAVVIDMYGFTCSRKPYSDGISLKG